MLALRYSQHGPPSEVLIPEKGPTPDPGPGEVRVQVQASPIDPLDRLILHGHYPLLLPLPATAGVEGAGVVSAVGDGVEGWEPGDAALLPVRLGAWAEEVVAPADELFKLPAGIDPVQAAMLRINPATALLLLTHFAAVEPGDWVVQFPGTSAVGQLVIQMAAQMGIKTVSILRNPDRAPALEALGADALVMEGENLAQRVEQATGGAEIRLALDAVGGKATHSLAQCLAPSGSIISYGALSRRQAQIGVDQTVFRDIRLQGFWLFAWNAAVGPQAELRVMEEVAGQVAAGALHTRIDSEFALSDYAAALERARSPECFGRVILRP
jgi:NADPH:quinone reductase-like Zn-dependent oxidoreductase